MSKKLSDMTLEELWALFPIALTPPKERWAEDYREMEARLRVGLSGFRLVRISHIGSTAIRGIWAKDIVDILVEIARSERLMAAARTLEGMGFTPMSASEGRCSLNWGYTEAGFADRVYHVHLRYDGDHDELYFRDYMNEHPACARAYEALKLDLWKRYEHDRDGYTNAKTAFVKAYTAKARAAYPGRYERMEDAGMDIERFWRAVLAQDRQALREYFADDAHVNWHCTNERFTAEEYIRANCDYPGDWDGEIERIERADGLIVTAVRVFPRDRSAFYHVVSFIRVENGKIRAMDEYWADDGDAPSWRRAMRIGQPIR